MQRLISELLQYLHESDQRDRHVLIATHGTSRMVNAKDPIPFSVFKGVTEERVRIACFLIEHGALAERDDYYYAAAIIINVGSLEHFITAYRLMKRYRDLGGERPSGFHDSYFERQGWGKTRMEVEAEVERQIGVHPRTIDRSEPGG